MVGLSQVERISPNLYAAVYHTRDVDGLSIPTLVLTPGLVEFVRKVHSVLNGLAVFTAIAVPVLFMYAVGVRAALSTCHS